MAFSVGDIVNRPYLVAPWIVTKIYKDPSGEEYCEIQRRPGGPLATDKSSNLIHYVPVRRTKIQLKTVTSGRFKVTDKVRYRDPSIDTDHYEVIQVLKVQNSGRRWDLLELESRPTGAKHASVRWADEDEFELAVPSNTPNQGVLSMGFKVGDIVQYPVSSEPYIVTRVYKNTSGEEYCSLQLPSGGTMTDKSSNLVHYVARRLSQCFLSPTTVGRFKLNDIVIYRDRSVSSVQYRVTQIHKARPGSQWDLLRLESINTTPKHDRWADEDEFDHVAPPSTPVQQSAPQAVTPKPSSGQCDCSASDLLWRGHKCGLKAKVDQHDRVIW